MSNSITQAVQPRSALAEPPRAPIDHATHDPAEDATIEAEIFSTGIWNGTRFEVGDLHEIARNFNALRHRIKPPLKFGHDEAQTLLGQMDGDPALGWVDALRVVGTKLVATFAGVPRVVREAIHQGRYRRVSAEIYFNLRRGRKKLGKALKAVALLGADLPAVTNLRDLAVYLAAEDAKGGANGNGGMEHGQPLAPGTMTAAPIIPGAITHDSVACFSMRVIDRVITQPQQEQTPMTEPEAPAMGGINGPVSGHTPEPPPLTVEAQGELAELRAYKARQENLQHAQAEERKREAYRTLRADLRQFTEAQVRAGRLLPHMAESLHAELERQARHFAQGHEPRVPLSWVRDFIAQGPARLDTTEVAVHAAEDGAGPGEYSTGADGAGNPSETLARRAINKMAELGMDYSEAAQYVLRADPALASAYRAFTLQPYSRG